MVHICSVDFFEILMIEVAEAECLLARLARKTFFGSQYLQRIQRIAQEQHSGTMYPGNLTF